MHSVANMRTVRMPISVAARKGVSAVAAEAADHRVILTSLGRPVAVVDAAERLDEDIRTMREAARAVVIAAADKVADRSARLDLDTVCRSLGLDADVVRGRADQLRSR